MAATSKIKGPSPYKMSPVYSLFYFCHPGMVSGKGKVFLERKYGSLSIRKGIYHGSESSFR